MDDRFTTNLLQRFLHQMIYFINILQKYFSRLENYKWYRKENFINFLSNFKHGNISYKKILSKESLKDLKLHYTEAKLVQLLEQKGIGRPSTFFNIN